MLSLFTDSDTEMDKVRHLEESMPAELRLEITGLLKTKHQQKAVNRLREIEGYSEELKIHRGDIASTHTFIHQTPGDTRQLRPAARQPADVIRLIDFVAELDRLLGAQPQQIAGRQRAAQTAQLIRHAEIAHHEQRQGAIYIEPMAPVGRVQGGKIARRRSR